MPPDPDPPVSADALVAEARSRIANLSPAQAAAEVQRGALLLDVREAAERASTGIIPGDVHAPRGSLEWLADPSSPHHLPQIRPDRPIVVYCAVGGRSALAADLLRRLGHPAPAHLDGGIAAWKQAGFPVTFPDDSA